MSSVGGFGGSNWGGESSSKKGRGKNEKKLRKESEKKTQKGEFPVLYRFDVAQGSTSMEEGYRRHEVEVVSAED